MRATCPARQWNTEKLAYFTSVSRSVFETASQHSEGSVWHLNISLPSVDTWLVHLMQEGCCKSSRMISIYIELTTWFWLNPLLLDSRQYTLQYRHGNLLSHPHKIRPPKTPTPVTVCLIAGTIIKCIRLFLAIKSTSVLLCVEVIRGLCKPRCNSGICQH
jgi:hypothetical protein